jgi:hypothetical protein
VINATRSWCYRNQLSFNIAIFPTSSNGVFPLVYTIPLLVGNILGQSLLPTDTICVELSSSLNVPRSTYVNASFDKHRYMVDDLDGFLHLLGRFFTSIPFRLVTRLSSNLAAGHLSILHAR